MDCESRCSHPTSSSSKTVNVPLPFIRNRPRTFLGHPIEKRSPASAAVEEAAGPKRITISNPAVGGTPIVGSGRKSAMSGEVLVVVSKMKQFIRDLSEMNTSEDVNQILSDKIRAECEKAIANARADGRKTVMARDFR